MSARTRKASGRFGSSCQGPRRCLPRAGHVGIEARPPGLAGKLQNHTCAWARPAQASAKAESIFTAR